MNQTASDIEDWAGQASDVQERAFNSFLQGFVQGGITGFQAGAKAYGSLTPPQANAYITQLKALGVDSSAWFDSLREVANTAGKPASSAAMQDSLEQLGKVNDAVSELPATQRNEGWNTLWEAAATFAGTFAVRSPQGNLILSGWSFISSLGWSAAGRAIVPARIDQLSLLSEDKLKGLASLKLILLQDVATIQKIHREHLFSSARDSLEKAAQDAWANVTKCTKNSWTCVQACSAAGSVSCGCESCDAQIAEAARARQKVVDLDQEYYRQMLKK